ncbi:MAG: ribonuclease E/G [Alphaproteobacteria bacterium]|nr:ribonuclease E/G [Alphaproteobacteria bacterium]
MKVLETWLDGSVGEARMALVDGGRPIALALWRATDPGQRARWGEVYAGRVTQVDRRRRGAFLDIGLRGGAAGFLPLDAQGGVRESGKSRPVREGERLAVRVAREAARGKNAVVEIVEPTAAEPGLLGRHRSDTQLIDAAPAPPEMRAALDAAFEAAAARTAPIPGGGRLVIEPTAALVAIDVDAADRAGSNDPEQFARDLNLAAAAEALRQIRLRDLGGVIAIDFVTLRSAKARDEVMAALKAHSDPWGLSFAPMSRFGIVEMARPQLRRPLAEALCDATGALSTETQALAALRAAESAGRAEPARRVVLTVAPEIAAWLEAAPFEWKPALTARLGPRLRLETGALRGRAFDAHTE